MTPYERIKAKLRVSPKIWLITGVTGFIGSNLLETLLKLDQKVVGLDNFLTGSKENLVEVKSLVTEKQWKNFRFIQGDIRLLPTCQCACKGVNYVLHQAALGSVPRSIEDPVTTHEVNVGGFLNMLVAARSRRGEMKRFVYASSSSVYGDDPHLPKMEHRIGRPLSPYAATKQINEIDAGVFFRVYGLQTIGLRYFNVFGPRQNSNGAYASVIPRWIAAMIENQPVYINGKGTTSRDFCFVENVVQANLLAATAKPETWPQETNRVFNIACGDRTTLNQLHALLAAKIRNPKSAIRNPVYRPFRPGDIPHSHANIAQTHRFLGYTPTHDIQKGLSETLEWYRCYAT